MSKVIWFIALGAMCNACASEVGDVAEDDPAFEAAGAVQAGATSETVAVAQAELREAAPAAELALPPVQLKKCIAGPFSTSGFGSRCPNYATVAYQLCTLTGEFIGGSPVSSNCQPIPNSSPQQYSYTLSYQCNRPQPCRY